MPQPGSGRFAVRLSGASRSAEVQPLAGRVSIPGLYVLATGFNKVFGALTWNTDISYESSSNRNNSFHLGGHWLSFFPKPVYWTLDRKEGQPFVEEDPKLGKVYHVGSQDDVLKLMQAEHGLMWTAHPRIKGSLGFPDKHKDSAFFKATASSAVHGRTCRPTIRCRASAPESSTRSTT